MPRAKYKVVYAGSDAWIVKCSNCDEVFKPHAKTVAKGIKYCPHCCVVFKGRDD